MVATIIIAVVLVILAFFCIGNYNSLVTLRNNRENAFADIDVQLKYRFDLLPNLVATVKGYATHEKELLENITKARSMGMSAQSVDDKVKSDQQMSSLLGSFKVAMEAYPELKANTNFLKLQDELTDIEHKLAAARRYFNSATREYNNAVETFPGVIFAGMFHFQRGAMYEVDASERAMVNKAPEVKF
ncbi:MAG: LemA family protein [Bacteroidaceae bacterium]|nr:LemA family protein [Bacteroidaceae bacterium]